MIVASQGTSQLVSGANVLESSIASNTAAITGGLPVAEVTPVAVTTVVSTRECAPLECSHCVVGAHKAPWGLTSLFIADESTFNACIALAFLSSLDSGGGRLHGVVLTYNSDLAPQLHPPGL